MNVMWYIFFCILPFVVFMFFDDIASICGWQSDGNRRKK